MKAHRVKKDDIYYTPADLVEKCRRVLGSIDTDPATDVIANQIIKAKLVYTETDSGLEQQWQGQVYCNPPYSRYNGGIGAWLQCYLERQPMAGAAIFHLPANTGSSWFQEYVLGAADLVCWLAGRIQYDTSDGHGRIASVHKAMSDRIFALYNASSAQEYLFSREFADNGKITRG